MMTLYEEMFQPSGKPENQTDIQAGHTRIEAWRELWVLLKNLYREEEVNR